MTYCFESSANLSRVLQRLGVRIAVLIFMQNASKSVFHYAVDVVLTSDSRNLYIVVTIVHRVDDFPLNVDMFASTL